LTEVENSLLAATPMLPAAAAASRPGAGKSVPAYT